MEWSLPGPSEFIRKSIDKLEDRKNIIFMLVEDFDTHLLRQALRKVIREREPDLLWQEWFVSDLINDYHIQPGEAITRAFGLQNDDPAAIHDAGFVAQSNNFSDLVIYLEGLNELDELDSQRWMRFLADYAHACRERQDRSLFCVPLIGTVTFVNPPKMCCWSICGGGALYPDGMLCNTSIWYLQLPHWRILGRMQLYQN